MRKFIHLSSETQDAAKWCAKRGYEGKIGDPLPCNLSKESTEEINKHKTLFRLCVHMHKT